jgi:hypothetical protein
MLFFAIKTFNENLEVPSEDIYINTYKTGDSDLANKIAQKNYWLVYKDVNLNMVAKGSCIISAPGYSVMPADCGTKRLFLCEQPMNHILDATSLVDW